MSKMLHDSTAQGLGPSGAEPSRRRFLDYLLGTSAVATLGAIKHEFGTSWAVISAVYQTTIAWIVAFLVYQGGRLLGFG